MGVQRSLHCDKRSIVLTPESTPKKGHYLKQNSAEISKKCRKAPKAQLYGDQGDKTYRQKTPRTQIKLA